MASWKEKRSVAETHKTISDYLKHTPVLYSNVRSTVPRDFDPRHPPPGAQGSNWRFAGSVNINEPNRARRFSKQPPRVFGEQRSRSEQQAFEHVLNLEYDHDARSHRSSVPHSIQRSVELTDRTYAVVRSNLPRFDYDWERAAQLAAEREVEREAQRHARRERERARAQAREQAREQEQEPVDAERSVGSGQLEGEPKLELQLAEEEPRTQTGDEGAICDYEGEVGSGESIPRKGRQGRQPQQQQQQQEQQQQRQLEPKGNDAARQRAACAVQASYIVRRGLAAMRTHNPRNPRRHGYAAPRNFKVVQCTTTNAPQTRGPTETAPLDAPLQLGVEQNCVRRSRYQIEQRARRRVRCASARALRRHIQCATPFVRYHLQNGTHADMDHFVAGLEDRFARRARARSAR